MQIDPALEGKHLYIEHLAQGLEAMASGRQRLNPVAYRLFARRLREAMAGYPEAQLVAGLARRHAVVAETLADRHFDNHGRLPGPQGPALQRQAGEILARLGGPA